MEHRAQALCDGQIARTQNAFWLWIRRNDSDRCFGFRLSYPLDTNAGGCSILKKNETTRAYALIERAGKANGMPDVVSVPIFVFEYCRSGRGIE